MTREDEIEDALPGATRLREKHSLRRFRNHSTVKGDERSRMLPVSPQNIGIDYHLKISGSNLTRKKKTLVRDDLEALFLRG